MKTTQKRIDGWRKGLNMQPKRKSERERWKLHKRIDGWRKGRLTHFLWTSWLFLLVFTLGSFHMTPVPEQGASRSIRSKPWGKICKTSIQPSPFSLASGSEIQWNTVIYSSSVKVNYFVPSITQSVLIEIFFSIFLWCIRLGRKMQNNLKEIFWIFKKKLG